MGKSERHKRNKKEIVKTIPPVSTEQIKLSRVIANIGMFLVLTPIFFGSQFILHKDKLSQFGQELQNWCLGILMLTVVIKIGVNREVQVLGDIFANEKVHKKFRHYLVIHIALSIFGNLVMLIPFLYSKGYITHWISYLPGKEVVENQTAIIISFCVAAIISSVAGNSAYDIVKYFVLKSFNKSD